MTVEVPTRFVVDSNVVTLVMRRKMDCPWPEINALLPDAATVGNGRIPADH